MAHSARYDDAVFLDAPLVVPLVVVVGAGHITSIVPGAVANVGVPAVYVHALASAASVESTVAIASHAVAVSKAVPVTPSHAVLSAATDVVAVSTQSPPTLCILSTT